MKPLVSIIIPVYNAALFVEKSIQELLKQTYKHIEIIAVNDGSTDNSLGVLHSIQANNLLILDAPNQGAAMARNEGLKVAKGEYIQFFDADDFLSYDKIERQVEALQGRDNAVAVCNYINFVKDEDLENAEQEDQTGFIYSSQDTADFLANLWGANGESNFIQTNCRHIRRSLSDKAGHWRNYRCPDDDGEFFARIVLAANEVIYVPGVKNYYRRTGSKKALSQNKNKKYLQNVLLSIDLKYTYLKGKVGDEVLKKTFAKQYLDFAVYNLSLIHI